METLFDFLSNFRVACFRIFHDFHRKATSSFLISSVIDVKFGRHFPNFLNKGTCETEHPTLRNLGLLLLKIGLHPLTPAPLGSWISVLENKVNRKCFFRNLFYCHSGCFVVFCFLPFRKLSVNFAKSQAALQNATKETLTP